MLIETRDRIRVTVVLGKVQIEKGGTRADDFWFCFQIGGDEIPVLKC